MPPGIPVATVAVVGAKNNVFLKCSILPINHPELEERLDAFREWTRMIPQGIIRTADSDGVDLESNLQSVNICNHRIL